MKRLSRIELEKLPWSHLAQMLMDRGSTINYDRTRQSKDMLIDDLLASRGLRRNPSAVPIAGLRNPKASRLPALAMWRVTQLSQGPAYFYTTQDGYRFGVTPSHGTYKVSVEGAFDATRPSHVWTQNVGERRTAAEAFKVAAHYYTYNLVRPVRKSLKRERGAGDKSGSPSTFREFSGRAPAGGNDFIQDWIAGLHREGRQKDLRERLAKARRNPKSTASSEAWKIVRYMMEKGAVIPGDLMRHFDLSSEKAFAICDLRPRGFGPGGKGAPWVATQVDKVLKLKAKKGSPR